MSLSEREKEQLLKIVYKRIERDIIEYDQEKMPKYVQQQLRDAKRKLQNHIDRLEKIVIKQSHEINQLKNKIR